MDSLYNRLTKHSRLVSAGVVEIEDAVEVDEERDGISPTFFQSQEYGILVEKHHASSQVNSP